MSEVTVMMPPAFPGYLSGSMDYWISNLDPTLFAQIGVASVLAFSVIGAGWGIYNTGTNLLGTVLFKPAIRSKNLLSILFCEAIAIYGIIIAFVLMSVIKPLPIVEFEGQNVTVCDSSTLPGYFQGGFAVFCSGVSVGLSCLAAGVTVGILGGGVTTAHADNDGLFVKLLICEIFAEAIALIALIAGVVVSTTVDMNVSISECLCPYMCRDGYCQWYAEMPDIGKPLEGCPPFSA